MKNFWKSVNIWQSYGREFSGLLFGPTCTVNQWMQQGRPQDFFAGGCKAGDHSSNIFMLCVDTVLYTVPDPTVIEKVDFRLQCYVT